MKQVETELSVRNGIVCGQVKVQGFVFFGEIK